MFRQQVMCFENVQKFICVQNRKKVIGVWAYELILYDYVLMYMTQGGGGFPRRREMVNGLSG